MADRHNILNLLLKRVEMTRSEIGNHFPYYADPEIGKWVTTVNGDWCSGHWIESLRITGELTGKRDLIDEAIQRTHQIKPMADFDDMFRAAKFYYSAARLAEAEKLDDMRDLALDIAERMRGMAIPSNGGMAIGTQVQVLTTTLASKSIVAVDNVHPNLMLDWYAGNVTDNSKFHAGARRHLDLTIKDYLRDDGSTVEFIEYDYDTGRQIRHFTLLGAHDESCWSRGQAWAIGGYLRAWEELGDLTYLEVARRLFDFWIKHTGEDFVPPWDFFDPKLKDDEQVSLDTSALAIVVAQLARLAVLDNNPAEVQYFVDYLDPMLDGLSAHMTPLSVDDKRPVGMLLDGCFNNVKDFANRHELIWGNFFLLEALYCLGRGGLPC